MRDIGRLRSSAQVDLVIWAGDFNQTLEGPAWGGSLARRALLVDALAHLGLVAYNAGEAHAREGMNAVDLICGPPNRSAEHVARIPRHDGQRWLSDHAGYVVDLQT